MAQEKYSEKMPQTYIASDSFAQKALTRDADPDMEYSDENDHNQRTTGPIIIKKCRLNTVSIV